jgi:hypothetical protein
MRNFAYLYINGLDSYGCTWIYICFFQNLNILCSFWSISFYVQFFSHFLLVWSDFTFLGSTGPVQFPVLITLHFIQQFVLDFWIKHRVLSSNCSSLHVEYQIMITNKSWLSLTKPSIFKICNSINMISDELMASWHTFVSKLYNKKIQHAWESFLRCAQ